MIMAKGNVSYKKFTIQTIVNPGTFWVLEYGRETQTETKPYLSPKDVRRFKHFDHIRTGQMVAVNHDNELKRGLIIDVYNRCKKASYIVLLVDNGCSIETSVDSIFMIRTSELRNKKSNAFEVLVHGIQPVTVELFVGSVDLDAGEGCDNGDGIFHNRTTNKWSPAAFKFIKDLLKRNSCIYVNCININGASITGDVYYKQEGVGGLMSLAQTLCDKDFAVFSENKLKMVEFLACEGKKYSSSIERKIPTVSESEDASWEELNIASRQEKNESYCSGNACSCSGSNKSTYSEKSLKNEDGERRPDLSNSWIVKKMRGNLSPTTYSEFIKSGSDKAEKIYPKVSLFKVVQRNMELYDKSKLKT